MRVFFYKPEILVRDHTTFGGKIYFTDFDRKTTLSEIAEKIISDRKFDQQCMKNAEIRKEWKKINHSAEHSAEKERKICIK